MAAGYKMFTNFGVVSASNTFVLFHLVATRRKEIKMAWFYVWFRSPRDSKLWGSLRDRSSAPCYLTSTWDCWERSVGDGEFHVTNMWMTPNSTSPFTLLYLSQNFGAKLLLGPWCLTLGCCRAWKEYIRIAILWPKRETGWIWELVGESSYRVFGWEIWVFRIVK